MYENSQELLNERDTGVNAWENTITICFVEGGF